MKQRTFKNFLHVLLFGSLLAMSCSKENEPVQSSQADKQRTAATEQTAYSLTPQTVGITAQSVYGDIGNVKQYLQYLPSSYNYNLKTSYKWALVIFLHGIGEIGTDVNVLRNVALPKVVMGKPFVMLAPQCTSGWWNPSVLQKFLKQMITKYDIDTNRICVTGISMGGFGAWDWSLQYPKQFASVVPICGGGTVSMACNLKYVPVWAFHNADDPTVSVWNSRDMVKAIRSCGGTLVKYTENPTGGHNAWTKAYADSSLYTWILKQRKRN
jgi:predicted peptidase